jgi:hypothetical protein
MNWIWIPKISDINIELDFNMMEEPEEHSGRWMYEAEKYRLEMKRQALLKSRKEKLQRLDLI